MIETDALVIGAGPAGLFQVFELGLLEIGAHVVDALPVPGGQLIELYPDKPIYDIPGIPACSARDLVARLLQQVEPFKPTLHLGQEVASVEPQADGRFLVVTSAGTQFMARTVIVASGVGAFQPRRLPVEGLERHQADGQVQYHLGDDLSSFTGLDVVVCGGGEAAVRAAVTLAELSIGAARSVSLVHRRDVFQADDGLIARLRHQMASGRVTFVAGQPAGIEESPHGRLLALNVLHGDAQVRQLPVDRLLVSLGLSPKLGPLADWGVALDRKQVVVDSATFETQVNGIFAIGDAVTYPGKKRLILCGFHEAALASFAVAARVHPERKGPLQYTTTSTRLHQLLGVSGH